jgi:hypothetical protein
MPGAAMGGRKKAKQAPGPVVPATAAPTAASQPLVQWPSMGKIDPSITAHAHQLIEDASALSRAIQDRQKSASVPSSKLTPLCDSIQAFVQRFLTQTGVQAWETHLNEISHSQQQQAKQIEALTKAVNKAATIIAPESSGSNPGGARVQSWAQVARDADPPPATRTIQSWTSATGSSYQEYVTGPREREIIVKLHNSSTEEGKAIKTWIQGKLANQPRALTDHINKAIQRAAEDAIYQDGFASDSEPDEPDTEMADTTISPETSGAPGPVRATTSGPIGPPGAKPPKPYSGIQVHSAVFLKSGDIQIHTAYVSQTKILLAYADEWAKYVGNKAKVVIPTYGVVIHAIPTVTFDPAR